MRRILAAFAAASLIPTVAHAIVTRHDVAGERYLADEDDYPALATLFTTPSGARDCVATLITPQWLITAKHCTMDEALDGQVAAGTFAVTFAGGTKAQVAGITRMPDEEGPPQRTDVALIKLAEPIAGIEPVKLYAGGDELGRIVFFPGWGDTGVGTTGVAGEPDGNFRVAENRVDSTFDNFLIFRFDDPRSHLGTALALEGISGPGDSGGPALIATPHGLQIAGVSSAQRGYGPNEGVYNVDEYYVRISAVRDWIDLVIPAG